MPIIVGGKKFDPKAETVVKPEPKKKVLPPSPQPVVEKVEKPVVEIDKYTFDKNKTYLVVNGEVHELRKKSAFLMDMITK